MKFTDSGADCTVEYEYDRYGNVTKQAEHYSDGSGTTHTYEWKYNAKGDAVERKISYGDNSRTETRSDFVYFKK